MSKAELRVELEKRYCPTCRFDTQHAVLRQFGNGAGEGVEEVTSSCAICNADRYWGLKLDAGLNREKFVTERWMPRIS